MQGASIEDFRATLVVIGGDAIGNKEQLYTYWNNLDPKFDDRDRESILHIVKREDGAFYLEIGNIQHRGPLEELEQKLFEWAASEGYFQ